MFDNYDGTIDIIKFLKEEYNYEYTNDLDLSKQDFIEFEGIGKFALMWIKDKDNNKYLFKTSENNLGELLSMKIAKILNIPCAEYRLATLGKKKGILSKKFTKNDESILLGGHIIQEVINHYPYLDKKSTSVYDDKDFIELYNIPDKILKLDNNKKVKYFYNYLNNLEILSNIISLYYKNQNETNIDSLMGSTMFYLINIFLFDILTIQADRHPSNWGIGKRKNGDYFMIHLYDNNASFCVWYDDLDKKIDSFNRAKDLYEKNPTNKKLKELKNIIYKKRPFLTVSEQDILNPTNNKRRSNLEMLDTFLTKSPTDYIQLFDIYITFLEDYTIEKILQELEKENKIELSEKVKQYIKDIFNLNLKFCKEVLEKHMVLEDSRNVFKGL